MKRIINTFAIAGIFCMAAASGCVSSGHAQAERGGPAGEASQEASSGPVYAESRPRAQDRNELTVVFSNNDVELDFRKSIMISEAQLYTAIYEGLFSYHPLTMEPVPALAQRWELSEDRKQWTFTIRDNARFSNGDPVRAQDFRATWLSLLDPAREAPYASLFDIIEGAREFRTGAQKNPDRVGIIAQGPNTLVVRLNAPAGFFPSMLCHHSFSPAHHSMLGIEDWSRSIPVSNGPFRITEMNEGRMVFEKNQRYWDAANVALNTLIIRFAEADEASRLWNSGEARWIAGEADFDALTDLSGIQVNTLFATHYYFIRSGARPWNDYRVRRALVLALPWDEIRAGHFRPAATLIYPLSGYPEINGVTDTDLDEARRLLAQAGFPGGAGLPELVIRITPSQDAARIAGLMAGAWSETLGISARVEIVPFSRYYDTLKLDGYTVGFLTWIGDFPDPYTFLKLFRRDSNLNDAQHSDDDFETLMERSMFEEGEARWATLAEAEQLLLDRGSVMPISFTPALNIIDIGELGGWFLNALDIHPFKYMYFRAFRPLPNVALGN